MKLNRLNRRSRLHESEYTERPKNKDELVKIIRVTTRKEGDNCDLNFIDVSRIKDMSYLFSDKCGLNFFNGDISEWDVSNVEDMSGMFMYSDFNQDISKWNVSKVKNMEGMFLYSHFNQDISDWDISNIKNTKDMLTGTKIKDEYKPQLKTNESRSLTESRNRISSNLRRFI